MESKKVGQLPSLQACRSQRDGRTHDKEGMFAVKGGTAEGRCGWKMGGEEGLHKGRNSGGTPK